MYEPLHIPSPKRISGLTVLSFSLPALSSPPAQLAPAVVANGDPAGWDEKDEFSLPLEPKGEPRRGEAFAQAAKHSMSFRDIAEAAEEYAAAQLSAQLRRIRATLAALDDATVDALTETASERAPPPPEVAAELAETLATAAAELSAAAHRIHLSTKPQPLPPPPPPAAPLQRSETGSRHGLAAAAGHHHSLPVGAAPPQLQPPPHAHHSSAVLGAPPHHPAAAQHRVASIPALHSVSFTSSAPSSPSRKFLTPALATQPPAPPLAASAPVPSIVQRRPSSGAAATSSFASAQGGAAQPLTQTMRLEWAGSRREAPEAGGSAEWTIPDSATARQAAQQPLGSSAAVGLIPPPPAPAVSLRRMSAQEASLAQQAAITLASGIGDGGIAHPPAAVPSTQRLRSSAGGNEQSAGGIRAESPSEPPIFAAHRRSSQPPPSSTPSFSSS